MGYLYNYIVDYIVLYMAANSAATNWKAEFAKNARTTCRGGGMVYPCLSLAGKQHDALLAHNVGHGGLNLTVVT